ncbi:MAG: hypothetical protein HOV81_33285 [Kofleriaceae bacterium]|nr:hypothetical protein [Kofleriaceae bacterium]
MRRVAVVLVLLALVACRRGRKPDGDMCLALPAAIRTQLTAGPDGRLYWLERARDYDFDAELTGVNRLVRYDLRNRRAEVVFDDAGAPIRFIGGQLLALRHSHSGSWTLVLLAGDLHTQELTSSSLDVRDVEVLDAHTVVFLAEGVGARAVYVLGLDELKPYHLVDADILLSASGGHVFARKGDDVLVVDVKTRAISKVPYIRKSEPQGASLVHLDGERVLVHDMLSHETKPVELAARKWKLVYQGDTTLARTAPSGGRSYASVVANGRATALPTIVGRASIVSTAELDRRTWALIAHNTTNYQGDVGETDAEADVCALPAAGDVTVPTRVVPARFADRSQPLFDALEATSPTATLQFIDADGAPPTVSLHLLKESAGSDLAAMRKRARDLEDRVTRQLRDPEIRTDVMFADRRRAVYRWRRDRQRSRITVGMGDALLSDREDYDFEVSKVENERKDGKITCSGTLRNLTHRALTGLDIKCSGNRNHLIHIDKMEVDETRAFSQTFEISEDGEAAYLEVLLDGKPSEPRDAEQEERDMAAFTLATEAFAATGLWLDYHAVRDDDVVVSLLTDIDFLERDAAAQEAAIKAAYEQYTGLRAIYGLPATAPLHVRVRVQLSDAVFRYDGSRLASD